MQVRHCIDSFILARILDQTHVLVVLDRHELDRLDTSVLRKEMEDYLAVTRHFAQVGDMQGCAGRVDQHSLQVLELPLAEGVPNKNLLLTDLTNVHVNLVVIRVVNLDLALHEIYVVQAVLRVRSQLLNLVLDERTVFGPQKDYLLDFSKVAKQIVNMLHLDNRAVQTLDVKHFAFILIAR